MSQKKEKPPYYDLARIRSIPILDVCASLGIEVKQRGDSYWCKVRDEKTASTILHPENNTYHDFGSDTTGGVIDLVRQVRSCDFPTALDFLAQAHGIEPERGNSRFMGLSNSEWSRLGISGDVASKNLDLDLSHQAMEYVKDISDKCNLPMNKLKSKHPYLYANIIWGRAIPTVISLRNDYYAKLFATYNLCASGSMDWPTIAQTNFQDDLKQLHTAEVLLQRACSGSRVQAQEPREYNPETDINRILAGQQRIHLDGLSVRQMSAVAKAQNTAVKYQVVPALSYSAAPMEPYSHGAQLIDGQRALVSYLECDYKAIKPILTAMEERSQNETNLEPESEDLER